MRSDWLIASATHSLATRWYDTGFTRLPPGETDDSRLKENRCQEAPRAPSIETFFFFSVLNIYSAIVSVILARFFVLFVKNLCLKVSNTRPLVQPCCAQQSVSMMLRARPRCVAKLKKFKEPSFYFSLSLCFFCSSLVKCEPAACVSDVTNNVGLYGVALNI